MHRARARQWCALAMILGLGASGCAERGSASEQATRAGAQTKLQAVHAQEHSLASEGKQGNSERMSAKTGQPADSSELIQGKPTEESREGSAWSPGQYALKSQGAAPQLARKRAIDQARKAGVLGISSTDADSNGAGFALGGGTGWDSSGTGHYGTIGYGAGSHSGAGYGRGGGGHAGRSGDAAGVASSESYTNHGTNDMTRTDMDRFSTFSVDVDTGSYTIARRKIREGEIPPPASVRVEEFINYFRYTYPGPQADMPFSVHMDAAPSPFTKGRHLLRVGVQARTPARRERKPVNLVFLVDVSGSMASPDKLDLAKRALRVLVDNLRDGDTVAMVTYAGTVRVALEPTGIEHKGKIQSAVAELSAGGSTAMGSGIELAYQIAARNLRSGAVSRVIVLSDGDANVGNTTHAQILATIAGHVSEGVTLSTVGFGMGNYKDDLMEQLANKGDGNYYYIDGIQQARRVFQEQLGGTLEVVARDAKIQVELDPDVVSQYRLIGYENRNIEDKDFRNDRVDAGEIGAGHTVTALYELELRGDTRVPLATVHIRAKQPRGENASEWTYRFDPSRLSPSFDQASSDFRFATAVMGAAEILRRSKHAREWQLTRVVSIAGDVATTDERRELVELLHALAPRLAARL